LPHRPPRLFLRQAGFGEIGDFAFDDRGIAVEEALPPALSHQLVGELHPSVDEPYRSKHEGYIANTITAIENNTLTFVQIDTSHGCNLVALCENVDFS
jgi:hypothetical protein